MLPRGKPRVQQILEFPLNRLKHQVPVLDTIWLDNARVIEIFAQAVEEWDRQSRNQDCPSCYEVALVARFHVADRFPESVTSDF